MKKAVVNYRNFRLSQINTPEFSHLKLLFGWVVYFVFYFLTENLIAPKDCYSVHFWLDDIIPFHEIFVIPYVFWYGLIIYSLLYFMLYNIQSFRNLQKYIILTQAVAVFIYILFPTRQDLRPDIFPRDNFLTSCVAFLYRIDTNTGVCPSLHVAISGGIVSVWCKEKDVTLSWKGFIIIAAILICLSTMFIKQHSAVDVLAAIPLCLLAEWCIFRKQQ